MIFRIHADDDAAAAWLSEFVHPWFSAVNGSATHVLFLHTSADAYRDALRGRPADATLRPCYAFDQFVLTLPSWTAGETTVFHDEERSCFLQITGNRIDLVADPSSRRWRIHLLWSLCENVATALRESHYDLHAAAVEYDGRSVVLCGPKKSGKSTLLLKLLMSGLVRFVSNDRTFIGACETGFYARGMPTAVKLRSDTLTRFPDLLRGIPAVIRPYLLSIRELREWPDGLEDTDVADFFALSTAQFANQLGASAVPSAPLAALLFPKLDPSEGTWRIERLSASECAAELRTNPYGNPPPRTGDPSLAIANNVPGFRLILGPHAYDDPDFAYRLMQATERG